MLHMLKITPLASWRHSSMSVLLVRDVADRITDADTEALAEQKMPIFRARRGEKHAHDEQRGRQKHREPEVAQVE